MTPDLSCDTERVTTRASFPRGPVLGLFTRWGAQESAAQHSAGAALGRAPTEPGSIAARQPGLGAGQLEDHAQSQADVLQLSLDGRFALRLVLFQQLNESSVTAESLAMPRQRYIFLLRSSKCSAVLWCRSPHAVSRPQGQGGTRGGTTN